MLATLRNVAHRARLLYQRRFEPVSRAGQRALRPQARLRRAATSSRWTRSRRAQPVLDIGAGPGRIAQRAGEEGLPRSPSSISSRRPTRRRRRRGLHAGPRRRRRRSTSASYDYLLLLDVIEHLKNPSSSSSGCATQFDYAPRTLVLTTPNIAFVVQRLMLLFGQFNYGKAGILDRTHTRLFTFRSLQAPARDAGFQLRRCAACRRRSRRCSATARWAGRRCG